MILHSLNKNINIQGDSYKPVNTLYISIFFILFDKLTSTNCNICGFYEYIQG